MFRQNKPLTIGSWILAVLLAALLVMSASIKILQPEWFLKGWEAQGFSASQALVIGIVEIACAVIFLIPQTSVLGAILVTGYLGGAVVTHVRGDGHFIPPVIIGMLFWLALFLRDPAIRELIPLRFARKG